jgi:hypothetical protein
MLMIAVAFAISGNASAEKVNEKMDYQGSYCLRFEQAEDDVDIETMFEQMEASPYASRLVDFWTTPACHAPTKNDTDVPILFNTATDVYKSEKFPAAIHDYLVNEKKQPEAWLKAINTKTTDGYTFLDLMQYNLARGYYSSKESRESASKVVKYLCQNGGVYSKYKDTAECP